MDWQDSMPDAAAIEPTPINYAIGMMHWNITEAGINFRFTHRKDFLCDRTQGDQTPEDRRYSMAAGDLARSRRMNF